VHGRVLVMDPDETGAALLLEALRGAGYVATHHPGDGDVLAAILQARPALLVLELRLPSLSGLEVLRRLRADPQGEGLPVMMVASDAEEVDRVAAFLLGVDDFVAKPFSPREVLLRCGAILRRALRALSPETSGLLEVGPVQVDRTAHRVRVSGREIRLTHLEFRLLVTLMSRLDRVQSRETLLSDVWGMRSDVSTRTVDTHVRRLRKKLGGAAAHLETVRGVGYRFVSRVTLV